MRYRDQPTMEVELVVAAPPEKVGRIVSGRLAEHRAAIVANLDEVKRRAELPD